MEDDDENVNEKMITLHVVDEAMFLSAALLLPNAASGVDEFAHDQSREQAAKNRPRNLTEPVGHRLLVVFNRAILRM